MLTQDYTLDVADILDFLEIGETLGIKMPLHLKNKLGKLRVAGSGKLKVALVGGFSEGKTSLAAAWLGILPSDMKISQSESSNAVTVYDANDKVELVDTPGLFGFKETNVINGTAEKYKEMTRKYVSESDVLLYVLNPSNPLKESHKQELIWLFRELGLLARTVFVIGRFDMVADVEDDADYERNLEIKKANIKLRLKDLVDLTAEEEKDLSIVGVAANPFDQGIESWFERPDEYARLSHIADLRMATAKKVDDIGGAEEAKRQSAVAILRDVTDHLLLPARRAAEESEQEAAIADGKAREEQPRLNRYLREAGEAQITLRREVMDYFGDLITEAMNTEIDSFGEFFVRKVGSDGIVVNSTIANAFTRELGPISQQLTSMSADFVAAGSSGTAVTGVIGMIADKAKGITINNTMILKARDWVMPAFKFKPYGAIKAARFANGALAGIGLVIEGWSMWRDSEKTEKFKSDRQAIVDDLNEQRAAILAQIDAPDFLTIYFPQIDALRILFSTVTVAFTEAAERNRKMQLWATDAETLHLRYVGSTKRLHLALEDIVIDL